MATGAQVWSTSAASNNSADSSVNWAEGMAPSAVNNSARAEMASAAMWIGDNSGTLLTSGSTTAYTVTSKQVQTAVTDGYTMAVRFHATNDAAATLNVDGVAAKAIQLYGGQGLLGGEFKTGAVARFTYTSSSTSWVLNNFTAPTTTVALPGSATVASSFEVGKATLLSSALTVSGVATLSSSLTVAKASLFSSDLAVTGDITAANFTYASQAEQETATATNRIVAPGTQKYHPTAAKAWARITWSAGVPALTEGTNISTAVTDNGSGDVSLAFVNPMSSTTYAVLATAYETSTIAHAYVTSATTAAIRVQIVNQVGSAVDPEGISVLVFGDLP